MRTIFLDHGDIKQPNAVIQTNATATEELSSISEQMQGEVNLLHEQVKYFVIETHESVTRAPVATRKVLPSGLHPLTHKAG